MRKKILITILVLILALIVGVGISYNYYQQTTTLVTEETDSIEFFVEQGDSIAAVAPELETLGVIRNLTTFRIYMEFENEIQVNLLPGRYELPLNTDIPSLLNNFNNGPLINTARITIPEGLRGDEVAESIENQLPESFNFNKDTYLDIYLNPDKYSFSTSVSPFLSKYKPSGKTLEGFLFADTYTIAEDATEIDIVNLQISTLINRLSSNDLDIDNISRLDNFYDSLILASIVEREALKFEDRELVADIFISRLEKGMFIGADATLLYPKKDWGHELFLSEINDTSNPYNTRALPGLTPTPICNPSIDSIIATLNPKVNDYLYFISDSTGTNHYAVTYSQHLANINKYL